jgi:hypothetical protein
MGNHEYCVDCGASDFHLGSPCEPELLAAEQSRQKAAKAYIERKDRAAKRVCAELLKLGYPARIGNCGHVIIEKWDLK